MLNDDDGLDRRRNLNERERSGSMMIMALAALAVLGVLLLWAPWQTRTADNAPPGTTVGSSTNRPAAPAAPAPSAPASPSTTR